MTAVPAPTAVPHREEWADDDFDIPDGHAIAASDAESDKEDDADEDWDAEMHLGPTGGARIGLGLSTRSALSANGSKAGFIPFAAMAAASASTVRPTDNSDEDNIDEDEGVSTIKLSSGPTLVPPPRTPLRQSVALADDDDDVESDFALPSDLSQLSLRPLEPHHPSKGTIEWGDKDHTSSSTCSSDAYSNLGLGVGASPSSFGTSTSQPETETEDDEDEAMLEGIVVPSGLFDSAKGGKELVRMLELKKQIPTIDERAKAMSPEEDDFEIGLVIDDDMDLSPSRLLQKKQGLHLNRSKSVPPRASQAARPPSRLRTELGQQPPTRPQTALESSTRVRNTRSPTFVRPRPPSRGQPTAPPVSLKRMDSSSSTLHIPRSQTTTGLRSQKSHGVLNPPSGPARPTLVRKASLSTLLDQNTEATGSSAVNPRVGALAAPTVAKSASSMSLASRYEGSTAASRAKVQNYFQSSSRLHAPEFKVPPTRPSTPSSNPAALRLTMPTASSRLKSRPAIASIFSPTTPAGPSTAASGRTSTSPLPRPPSATERSSRVQPQMPVAKPLRKPKRPRQYGDGTELDQFEDLPTDRDKERKYRVAPKTTSSRPAPPRTSPSQGTVGRRSGRDSATGLHSESTRSNTGTLRRLPPSKQPDSPTRRRRAGTVTNLTRRKPTLIRNLGGSNAPKVVGDMKWNPQTLRWEGNEQVLKDFDATVGTSTRPALITHLTGSSIGSPVSSFATGARIVGNMIFDPTRMCWISRLPPEEDEPDVFADMADDEDEDWDDGKGGTIRANVQNHGGIPQTPSARSSIREESPSPAASSRHSRAFSDITSDGEFPHTPVMVDLLDLTLVESTRAAETRHRAEMKGWVLPTSTPRTLDAEQDREHLWYIRAVATKNYDASS